MQKDENKTKTISREMKTKQKIQKDEKNTRNSPLLSRGERQFKKKKPLLWWQP